MQDTEKTMYETNFNGIHVHVELSKIIISRHTKDQTRCSLYTSGYVHSEWRI
jgi:hypothetical protein